MVSGFIYARVSPTNKKEGLEDSSIAYSIENQLKKCRAQAAVDGVQILCEYNDEYISGKSVEYMDSYKKMLKDVDDKLKPNDMIYVLRVDRFGRSLHDMIVTEKMLREKNIFIKFVEQGFNTKDTFGRMIMGIMGSIAEWQRETIVTNTKMGRDKDRQLHPEKYGRPLKKLDFKDIERMVKSQVEGKYVFSWQSIANKYGVTAGTLKRRYKKEFGSLPIRRV